jgi:hypothetical protein
MTDFLFNYTTVMKKWRTANTGLAKVAVQCSASIRELANDEIRFFAKPRNVIGHFKDDTKNKNRQYETTKIYHNNYHFDKFVFLSATCDF